MEQIVKRNISRAPIEPVGLKLWISIYFFTILYHNTERVLINKIRLNKSKLKNEKFKFIHKNLNDKFKILWKRIFRTKF